MKLSNVSLATVLLLAGNLALSAKDKTATPTPIPAADLLKEPYRYNGAALTDKYRGSGFCAWSNKTFFTAGHLLYQGSQWVAPPIWYPQANSVELDEKTAIPSRGYYRWTNYATLLPAVTLDNPEPTNFGYDAILAFAFEKLIKGKPATLNLNGISDLRRKSKTLITGYPTENAYLGKDIEGYFLHKTGPVTTSYETYEENSLFTTLVSPGKGNSGGPIWTLNSKSKWNAAGIFVGRLPSESVVHPFSEDTNHLLRAVTPVIQPQMGAPHEDDSVSSYSSFFPYNRVTKIPDNRRQWTSFRVEVGTFPAASKVKFVKLSLNIQTPHRGDLFVVLEGPQGFQRVIHSEQGNKKKNLVRVSEDVSESFLGIVANGDWYLRVQDRLAGDIATFKSFVLEIATDDVVTTPTP